MLPQRRRFIKLAAKVTASIATKGDVYYIVIGYYVGLGDNRKRKQKWIKTDLSASGNNKRKIEAKRQELLAEWDSKVASLDNDILFADYLLLWLEETKHTISEETYYSYRNTVKNVICPYFRERKIKLCDLKGFDIQSFYAHKMETDKVSANTIHHYHANIHKCLSYAVKTDRLKSNPSDKVELPSKEKHLANFYSVEDCKKILEVAKSSKIEIVVYLAAKFGLRRGEIIGLRWDCVDFDNKVLYIRGTMSDRGASGSKVANTHYKPNAKTDASYRAFPMSDATIEYLKNVKAWQDKRKQYPGYNLEWSDYVCVRVNGDLIPLEYVTRVFPKMCENAGMKRLRLHELRHTNVSLLLEKNMNMKEISAWSGHSTISTTMNIYGHLQAKTKTKMATAIDELLENC